MTIRSFNPATEELLQDFPEHTDQEVEKKVALGNQEFQTWKHTTFGERKQLMLRLAEILKAEKEQLGKIITLEMGKPIRQSIAEVEKCAWCAEYFAQEAENFLKVERIETDAQESYVTFEPLGIVLAIMPWNYPLWQVIRFIVPAAMAGNVGILKHASNVPQCALALERIFREAGFPEGVFQSILVGPEKVENLIRDPRIKAVTLTGSEYAGSQVGREAGEQIKKAVLELGGSNAFLVLEDADLELAAAQAVTGRFQNAGQSCIAAKRFIVLEKIAAEFLQKFKAGTEKLVLGNPIEETTDIGPLCGKKALEEIEKQVQKSLEMGAELVTGGKRAGEKGYFYEPTILTNVKKGMPAYDEETFGPVAAVMIVKDIEEAVKVANDTEFGLGASIFTQDLELAKKLIPKLYTSTVFVNGMVKSDPRLPFGGIGKSGFGRELSHYGIKEFVNVKTIWLK